MVMWASGCHIYDNETMNEWRCGDIGLKIVVACDEKFNKKAAKITKKILRRTPFDCFVDVVVIVVVSSSGAMKAKGRHSDVSVS